MLAILIVFFVLQLWVCLIDENRQYNETRKAKIPNSTQGTLSTERPTCVKALGSIRLPG